MAELRWLQPTPAPAQRRDGRVLPLRHLPPLETDAQAFRAEVEVETGSRVVVMQPSGTIEL